MVEVIDQDEDPFAFLRGKTLAAVTFVWNYYQLLIDTETLSIYSDPVVAHLDKVHRRSDAGYRDAICGRIGAKVVRVSSDDDHLELVFSDGATLGISFKPEDRVARELQESLVVTNPQGNIMVVGDSNETNLDDAIGVSRLKRPKTDGE
jgi:hypothetical protein